MRRLQLLRAAAIAAFLVFHLVAITVRALPAPDAALDRASWGDPTVQKELAAWSRRLGVPQPRLEERLYALAERSVRVRDTLVAPFARYYEVFGTFQSWQMFVAPHRHPARLRVEVQEGGSWTPVFVEGQDGWLSRELSDTRFRSVIFRLGWPGFESARQHFADFVARRAARDFPRASQVRLVLSRADTPSPEQVLRGEEPKPVDDVPIVRELGRFR